MNNDEIKIYYSYCNHLIGCTIANSSYFLLFKLQPIGCTIASSNSLPISSKEKSAWFILEIKISTVKLGHKDRFDKEQIGVKKPFP